MELLAPAGSKESFAAALRGGADAVYLGIKAHNARVYAKNFSYFDLEVLLAHAHAQGKKVYVPFNTLVKQWEIGDIVASLSALERLKPDALIVQDLGVARIAREYFPNLELHASTQAAVHNSQGAMVLKEMGFKRIILARELSFSELKLISGRSSIELEVFCHGALCFSLSGMCLFSSAIGGHSGNRGRCTQPCRRIWKGEEQKGYLFSPKDLELAEYLPKLRSLGISSIKIEGRMRSSDYVYRVVKAYRTLLDAKKEKYNEALKEACDILAVDYARSKTSALFSGRDPGLFEPTKAQCLGLKIGTVTQSRKGFLSVQVSRDLRHGDRLRIADPTKDQTETLKVKEHTRRGDLYDLPYTGQAFNAGAPVFLVGDSDSQERSFKKEINDLFDNHFESREQSAATLPKKPYAAILANKWKRTQEEARTERLWLRIDTPGWLEMLPLQDANTDLVLSLNRDNIHAFLKSAKDLSFPRERVLCEFTPYISQREFPDFRSAVEELTAIGFSRWVLNNVSQFKLFKEPPQELVAGHFLYTWNAYAAAALKELGVSRFVLSWEDDILNIKELCRLALRGHLSVYLYGHPPLSRSRFMTRDMCDGTPLEERPGLRFKRVYESGSGMVIPEIPVALFNAREKLSALGIDTFGIDLSFIPPDKKQLKEILQSYHESSNPDASFKFNHKRTVK